DGDKYLCTFHLEGVKTSQLDELTDFIEEILPKNLGFLYAYTVESENTLRFAIPTEQTDTIAIYPGTDISLALNGAEHVGAAYLLSIGQDITTGAFDGGGIRAIEYVHAVVTESADTYDIYPEEAV
ncbi:hypothetical protein, partial [Selenomonas sp.]|uniref:hypothetical protein n=1 Tax=Selenomonas sp. TaxID=2053611 RepID=UPI0025D2DB37